MSRQSTRDAIPRMPAFLAWLRSLDSSQARRAEIIGVSRRCIEYWETGKRWPTVSKLRRFPDGIRALADDMEQRYGHR